MPHTTTTRQPNRKKTPRRSPKTIQHVRIKRAKCKNVFIKRRDVALPLDRRSLIGRTQSARD
jgi:hypothetical protein